MDKADRQPRRLRGLRDPPQIGMVDADAAITRADFIGLGRDQPRQRDNG